MKKVEIISEKEVYKGFFCIKQYELKHKLFNGGWNQPLIRELFVRDRVASVLPFDPDTGQVVLIQQFRLGALEQDDPWLLEAVAGIIEKDESAENMVERELKEEAGLILKDLLPIYQYWTSPGGTNEHMSLFLGRVDASDAKGVYGAVDEGEDINVITMSLEEAYNCIETGKINNAMTIIALQWLKLHVEKVLTTW